VAPPGLVAPCRAHELAQFPAVHHFLLQQHLREFLQQVAVPAQDVQRAVIAVLEQDGVDLGVDELCRRLTVIQPAVLALMNWLWRRRKLTGPSFGDMPSSATMRRAMSVARSRSLPAPVECRRR
jgi:hypothetical protein